MSPVVFGLMTPRFEDVNLVEETGQVVVKVGVVDYVHRQCYIHTTRWTSNPWPAEYQSMVANKLEGRFGNSHTWIVSKARALVTVYAWKDLIEDR